MSDRSLFAAALVAALSCARAAAADPIKLHALAGPFKSLDQYCAESASRGRPCHLDRGWTGRAAMDPLAAAPPFRGARMFTIGGTLAGGAVTLCALAIETAHGWFVDDGGLCDGNTGPSTRVETLAAGARWVEDRGAPVLRVEYTSTRTIRSKQGNAPVPDSVDISERRWLVLCGLGTGGVPRCTDDVLVGCTDGHQPPRAFPWTFRDGRLALTSKEPDPECDIGLVPPIGRHRLAF